MTDPRTKLRCANPATCKSYGDSFVAGATRCRECLGDFTEHVTVSHVMQRHLQPVIDGVHVNKPEVSMQRMIDAVPDIRCQLEESGLTIEGSELGLAINLWLMQRIQALEATLRLRV